MKFIIFVTDTITNSASSDEMDEINKFNQQLRDNNQWIMGIGITGSHTAHLIDNRSGVSLHNPNSSLQGEEFYSGFWLIEAADEEQAVQLAMQGSQACNRKVELRAYPA